MDDPPPSRVSRKDYVMARESLTKLSTPGAEQQQYRNTVETYAKQIAQDDRVDDIVVVGNSGIQYKSEKNHVKHHPEVVLSRSHDSWWTPRRGNTFSLFLLQIFYSHLIPYVTAKGETPPKVEHLIFETASSQQVIWIGTFGLETLIPRHYC